MLSEKLKNRRDISLKDITPEKTFTGFHDFEIEDENGEKIGLVEIDLKEVRKYQHRKEIFIRSIEISKKGYGKSVYKLLQEKFSDYVLISDKETMNYKSKPTQSLSDAVYMWESLVKENVAKKIGEKEYEFLS